MNFHPFYSWCLPLLAIFTKKCEWTWTRNSACKYINLRIDMRDGAATMSVTDVDGERHEIDPKILMRQLDNVVEVPGNLDELLGTGSSKALKKVEEKIAMYKKSWENHRGSAQTRDTAYAKMKVMQELREELLR